MGTDVIEPDEIVKLAAMAAGTADGNWQKRVVTLVPKVAALFREPQDENDPMSLSNVARKVLQAHTFKAEYRGYELDDKGRDGNQPTQRLFVKIYDPEGQDSEYLDDEGCQTLRTEPMWSESGRAIRAVLDRMQHGQPAIIYRHSEQISKSKKTALLVHIEPRSARRSPNQGERASGNQKSAEAHPPAPADQAPAGAPAPPAGAVPSGDHAEALASLANRFDQLSGQQRVAFAKACRSAGLENFVEPSSDDLPRVLDIIKEVENT